jgi:hypothetical protein
LYYAVDRFQQKLHVEPHGIQELERTKKKKKNRERKNEKNLDFLEEFLKWYGLRQLHA